MPQLNLFIIGDFSNADEWTWKRLEILRLDGGPLKVVGLFPFIVCRETVVIGGVMRRSEVPPLLLILDSDMLDGHWKERTSVVDCGDLMTET